MAPLGEQMIPLTVPLDIGTNGITNGTIGTCITLNDTGVPLVPLVEP